MPSTLSYILLTSKAKQESAQIGVILFMLLNICTLSFHCCIKTGFSRVTNAIVQFTKL